MMNNKLRTSNINNIAPKQDRDLPVLLLTGSPGIGKTTVVKKVAASLTGLSLAGFYTDEIKSNGVRQGFAVVTFEGRRWGMAHVHSHSSQRVGKYGVTVEAIDAAVRTALAENRKTDLFLIDEIGKMECFSELFVQRVSSILTSGKPLIATVALKGGGFIETVKRRPGVALRHITMQNRNEMPDEIVSWIKDQRVQRK